MSKTRKLPPARNWRDRPIEEWNTTTFTEYLKDKHRELFGIEYAPMRSWRTEQGLIGNLIGTKTKPRKVEPAILKRFIDECFESYRPTKDWPGINFGFAYTYRRNVLQRLMASRSNESNKEEIIDWL